MDNWGLRAQLQSLILPVRVDPSGGSGPTKGQAAGPFWRRTGPGFYVPSSTDRSVPEQRIAEEACRLPPVGAVTGWAALRVHGSGYFDGFSSTGHELPVPLVVPPGTTLRETSATVVYRERLDPRERTIVHGVPVTLPVRAAFDAARRAVDLRSAVATLDMALASGVLTKKRIDAYLTDRTGWPGVTQVRGALGLVDARSMSPKETMLRLIWTLDAGLPRPRCNWPVADARGTLIGRPDLLSEQLAVVGEFDGAYHRSRERHRDDLRRDDRFRSVGFEPFRVVGADLHEIPVVLARIRTAIDRAARSNTPRTWLLAANPGPVS